MDGVAPDRLISSEVVGGDDTSAFLYVVCNGLGDFPTIEIRHRVVIETLDQGGEIRIANRSTGGLRFAGGRKVHGAEGRIRRKPRREHRGILRHMLAERKPVARKLDRGCGDLRKLLCTEAVQR